LQQNDIAYGLEFPEQVAFPAVAAFKIMQRLNKLALVQVDSAVQTVNIEQQVLCFIFIRQLFCFCRKLKDVIVIL